MSERRVNVAQEGAERQVGVEREAVVNNNIISPVQTVNGVAPDASGNIELTPADVGSPTTQELSAETSARQQADEQLNTAVGGKQDALSQTQMDAVNSGIDGTKVGQIATNTTNVAEISGKIPTEASASNQLADKAFVVETAQTNSAHFRGNWGTWADVPTDGSLYPADADGHTTPTSNDYLVVADASDFPVEPEASILAGTWRFKYSGTWRVDGKAGWLPEYQVNETPLTPAQIAALNSGINSEKVTKLDGIEAGAQKNAANTVIDANYVHTDNNYTTSEKEKLGGVEAGAEVNDINSVSVGGVPVVPDENKNVDIPAGEGGVLLLDVDNHTLTEDELQAFKDAWNSREPIFIHYGAVGGQIVHSQTGNTLDWTQPQTFSAIMARFDFYKDNASFHGGTVTFTPSTMKINFSWNFHSALAMEGDSSLSTASNGDGWVKKSAIRTALADKADKTAFTGTDGTSAGVMGLVPAPATTDAGKFLKADGSWGEAGGGGGIVELTTEDYDYPTNNPDGVRLWAKPTGIYSLAPGIKVYGANNHVMTMPSAGGLGFVFNPGANQSKYVYYGGSGQLTYLEVNHIGNQATLMTVPIATSDPMAYRVDRALSAAAGYTLQRAIGTLSTLTTTAKTSTVAAINEVASRLLNGGTTAPTASTAGAVGTQYTYVDTTGTPTAHLCVCTEIDNTDPSNPVYTWQTLI